MTSELETSFWYFPSSPVYQKWGFCVTSSGFGKIPPNHVYPPVAHPDHHNFNWKQGRILRSFTFLYIARGKGIFDSEPTGKVPVNEGTLFIVFPNVWHRYKPDQSTGWDEYWIEFEGNIAEHFINNAALTPSNPFLTVQNPTKMTDLFLDVIHISKSQQPGFEYMLSLHAFWFLTLLMTEKNIETNEDLEKTEIIRKAQQLLLADLQKPTDLKKISEELGMSYSLFRKTFKSVTGFSPYQYRLNFRLHRASQMLKIKDLQIGQIAENMGFKSIYHFSELFKKKNGVSPMEYRASYIRK